MYFRTYARYRVGVICYAYFECKLANDDHNAYVIGELYGYI